MNLLARGKARSYIIILLPHPFLSGLLPDKKVLPTLLTGLPISIKAMFRNEIPYLGNSSSWRDNIKTNNNTAGVEFNSLSPSLSPFLHSSFLSLFPKGFLYSPSLIFDSVSESPYYSWLVGSVDHVLVVSLTPLTPLIPVLILLQDRPSSA